MKPHLTGAEGPAPWRPDYRGRQWVGARLPLRWQPWPQPGRLQVGGSADGSSCTVKELRRYVSGKPWVPPRRRLIFVTDLHADAGALFGSLVAAGAIAKTGPEAHEFELTAAGKSAAIIIGGDCFDKGPSTFRLLASLRLVIDSGADVHLLAGNHDVRALLGLLSLGRTDARHAHLFARMGKKAVPWLAEAYARWVDEDTALLDDAQAAEALFPAESWYAAYPEAAAGFVRPEKISKELVRLREKCGEMRDAAHRAGLSLPKLEAAARACRRQLLSHDGELRWFFDRLTLLHTHGSYLFAHAGVDDVVARGLAERGADAINAEFRELLERDPFALYHGPLGNCFRTKYRHGDYPLTKAGLRDMRRAGLYAVVHGHRNLRRGQRLVMRAGLLNIECDASVDSDTRRRERLLGEGAAATLLEPDGHVIAVSSDFPYARVFHPAAFGGLTTSVGPRPGTNREVHR